MAVIDADTHVDESEATWESLEGAMAQYIPVTVTPPSEGIPQGVLDPQRSRWWMVEDRLQARAIRDDVHHPALRADLCERREQEPVDVPLIDGVGSLALGLP